MRNQSILMLGALLGLGIFGVVTNKAVANVTLLETAPEITGGGTATGGVFVREDQWLGARFKLDQPYRITDIGGNIQSSSNPEEFGFEDRSVFAALVPVSESNGFPSDTSLSETIYAVVFEAPYNDVGDWRYQVPDTTIDTNFTLEQGSYALIFGSGKFGATGGGWMTMTGSMIDSESYFTIFGMERFENWPREYGMRFFVHGEVIPAPGALPLCAIGVGLVGWLRRMDVRKLSW